MKIKTSLLTLAAILAALSINAQIIRRPPPACDCPAPGTAGCFINEAACEACWDACGDAATGAIRRVTPVDPWMYRVPRSVGVNLQSWDMSEGPIYWWHAQAPQGTPNWETLSMVRDEYDITAVNIMLQAHPTNPIYEDIMRMFRLPGVDIIVFRPEYWGVVEERCDGSPGVLYTRYPTREPDPLFPDENRSLFDEMYKWYADQDRDIFITGIEADWRLHGVGCRARDECVEDDFYQFIYDFCVDDMWQYTLEYDEPPSCHRVACDETKIQRGRELLLWEFNDRQAAAERARALNPDAIMRLWHVIEVNMFGNEDWQFITVLCDIIPQMDSPPDFIGLSLYKMAGDPVEALHYAMECTKLPANRFFISEVGSRHLDEQYDRIYSVVDLLFEEGVAFATVWSLDVLPVDSEWSVVDPHTGTWHGGMEALQDLNRKWR